MFILSWLPNDSPLEGDDTILYAFYASLLIQHGLYHGLSSTSFFAGQDVAQLKKRCWILTTLNALVTTLVSLPYLWELFASGLDLHAVKPRTQYTHAAVAWFVAYLISDLGLGSIYYRKLINFSSGWCHHTIYTFLFIYWAHKGFAHIAIMASVFELPTFIMGIASIHPPLRNNMAFTSTFFLTRIFFHLTLLAVVVTPYGRSAPGINGSWIPSLSTFITFPMHAYWGYKCVLSIRRRVHKRKLAAKADREKQANSLAQIAAQAFNGFQSPDASSAVNTPLPTPGASPLLSATSFGPFAKAAAAAGKRPIELVMRGGRRLSLSPRVTADKEDLSDLDSIPPLDSQYLQVPSSSSTTSVTTALQPSASPTLRPRLMPTMMTRSISNPEATTLHRPLTHPLTAPVRPEGATADSREPFLAIRSAAEASDRARRLVADGVRRLWFGAPESWRRQFEEEARLMEQFQQQQQQQGETSSRLSSVVGTVPLRRADKSLAEPVTDCEDSDGSEEAAVGPSVTEEKRTPPQRARAMLRRGVLKAVRRAINGKAGPVAREEKEEVPFILVQQGETSIPTTKSSL